MERKDKKRGIEGERKEVKKGKGKGRWGCQKEREREREKERERRRGRDEETLPQLTGVNILVYYTIQDVPVCYC